MKNRLKRGFTLIELLVVIAIIGILASVVLASLNSARDKGEDAAIKSNLNNIRAQAELFYDDNGDYDGVCLDTNVAQGVTAAGGECNSAVDGSGWAAFAPLSSASSSSYCVDSTGKAITTTTSITTGDTSCPAS
ncbi:hypothetical protein COU14_03625 [Candidatus Kaiserbacteria bacterium CG10_big_fil_rev_8_21_14_0_10_44_10]|uniref:Uncharacterized protein n=1 Tax=Candidatus Kaiserbacteria bacterium CG10_big_fil_rev_8_21_14_0_10_44_10 TaxID=1974606 RepID=A0A2H0UIQ9_9BACT|nr:MAG: hypothetical protein COU14_03625 [Candidatus Kaiserbacteria bacterium CG10_big_fil_rev_8_21_14_0_10_44_10]